MTQPPLFDLDSRDNWSGPAARHEDPTESHEAAANVEVKRNRLLVLKAYAYATRPLTYRQAALLVEPGGNRERVESLRRRCSDLKALGLIEQVGRDGRQGTFQITDAGYDALPHART